jgi:cysteine desulfurase / selenocysteine lyase
MIYLDHAATSWPKPPQVLAAMHDFLAQAGGNPGRSGHRLSIAAGRIVYDAREAVAELFGAPDPLRVIFTLNATHAINIALHGLLQPGDRVVTSGIEHNAVMRPLRAMAQPNVPGTAAVPGTWAHGIDLAVIPCHADGTLDMAAAQRLITPGVRLVALNHASNVMGTILPVAQVAALARRAGALLLVDAAQTAGALPIDMAALGIDLLAFTGHKALLGPPGTGGLVIGERVDTVNMAPLLRGGTGSRSEFEVQPEDCPDKFESGTPNGAGIAGLGAGIRYVQARGLAAVRGHEIELTRALVAGLANIPGVTVYGPQNAGQRTAVVSITVAGRRVSEVGLRLDEEHGVLSRVGLHCAPAAHRTIGTFPEGTIRLAAGLSTTRRDVQRAIAAVAAVAGNAHE